MEPREAIQLVNNILEQVPLDGPTRDRQREAIRVLSRVVSILEEGLSEKPKIPEIPKAT